jgi:hypothetical protein
MDVEFNYHTESLLQANMVHETRTMFELRVACEFLYNLRTFGATDRRQIFQQEKLYYRLKKKLFDIYHERELLSPVQLAPWIRHAYCMQLMHLNEFLHGRATVSGFTQQLYALKK